MQCNHATQFLTANEMTCAIAIIYLRKLPVERVRRRPPQQCPALTRDVSSNANVKSCENCSILAYMHSIVYFIRIKISRNAAFTMNLALPPIFRFYFLLLLLLNRKHLLWNFWFILMIRQYFKNISKTQRENPQSNHYLFYKRATKKMHSLSFSGTFKFHTQMASTVQQKKNGEKQKWNVWNDMH